RLFGPKGVGKTATARRRARSVLSLDVAENRQRHRADPELITRLPPPVLIDEWQREPDCWDVVRRHVDNGAAKGRYLLAGSATVPEGTQIHSGAGRIVGFHMRPMSLPERAVAETTVSLSGLLAGGAVIEGSTAVRLAHYVEELTASGLPGIRPQPPRMRRLLLDSYLDQALSKELPEQGRAVRRPEALRAWLSAYAAATATTASYERILAAATPGEGDKPSRGAVTRYRDILSELYLLDPLPAWLPGRNRLKRLGQAPKHYLADPALAARLLRVSPDALLAGNAETPRIAGADASLLGALFEHLAALSVRVHAAGSEARVYHLRTERGEHEVDLIVETDDARVVAFEVKLAQTVEDRDVRHLRWLSEQLGGNLVDAAVLTTGTHAYRRRDGIAVVPLALLGP
ncbi:MAG: DUF4143 domain-containing protein, partial [Bifidobacteriaceae bacterium]|nr:DUF4143 domain-containing protein [Bifidobacteriaceae bacterium]